MLHIDPTHRPTIINYLISEIYHSAEGIDCLMKFSNLLHSSKEISLDQLLRFILAESLFEGNDDTDVLFSFALIDELIDENCLFVINRFIEFLNKWQQDKKKYIKTVCDF